MEADKSKIKALIEFMSGEDPLPGSYIAEGLNDFWDPSIGA